MSRAPQHLRIVAVVFVATACSGGGTTDADPRYGISGSSHAGEQSKAPSEARCGNLGERFVSEACRDCGHASCCDELRACDAGSDCEKLDSCLRVMCADSCPLSEGICGTGVRLGSASCDACLTQSCCAPVQDCVADTRCSACLRNGDGDCASRALLDAAQRCALDNCTDACEG